MVCQHAPGGLQDILNETWGTNGNTEKNVLPSQKPSHQPNNRSSETLLPILDGPIRHCNLSNGNSPNGHLLTIGSIPPSVKVEGNESKPLSPFQFAKRVEKLLTESIRPMLQRDGGDLELIDIKEMLVYLELRGTCAACAGAGQTLKHLIERTLREQIDERIRVVQV
jgi:Fe-S cluster biogenesis protein NfuA